MTTKDRLRRAAAIVAVFGLLATGCGEEAASEPVRFGTRGEDIKPLDVPMPKRILGLRVERENVRKTIREVEDTYVDALSVYSLRKAKLLQATLQVSHMGPSADITPGFRRTIVNALGGQAPREVRVGDDTVWLATGANQLLISWFRDERFFVLSIRQDFLRPRELLRTILETEL